MFGILKMIRQWSYDDNTGGGTRSSLGYKVSATLANCDAIPLESMSIGMLQVLGSPAAVNVNVLACNDPNGANSTFTQLYDELGVPVQIPAMQSGHFTLNSAVMSCRAIKLQAVSGSDFYVSVFSKG